jgi:hypothetical protein
MSIFNLSQLPMNEEYRQHHFVPQWYQKKFMVRGQSEYYYLNLDPEIYTDSNGGKHAGNAVKKWGAKKCFFEDDLYTANINSINAKEIEKYSFGDIDRNGQAAVKYFEDFSYPYH